MHDIALVRKLSFSPFQQGIKYYVTPTLWKVMHELSTPNDINLFFAAIFPTLVIELLCKIFIKHFQNFTSCIYILYLWFWKLFKWLHNFKSSNSQYTNFRAFMQIILNSDYIIYVKLLLSVDVIILSLNTWLYNTKIMICTWDSKF